MRAEINFVELSGFSEALEDNGYEKVVFCKDCLYCSFGFCGQIGGLNGAVAENDYCSRGKERTIRISQETERRKQ